MPGKIANTLPDDQLARFCDELRAQSGAPTIRQIRDLAKKYGIASISNDAAVTFRDNTFKAHLDRLRTGREKTETILKAIRGADSPLTAFEEAAAADILDSYTNGDEDVDRDRLIKAGATLRSAIEERNASARAQAELERRQTETAKKLEVADRQLRLRDQQIAKLEREKADWERQRADAQAAVAKATKKAGLGADTRKLIEDALARELG